MNDWTSGYVADIDYTYGYYTELNPQRVRLAFLNAGLVAPENGTACELGFGQGLSANFHAAASMTQWFGTDFNPAQAGFAQELAAVSGSEAKLFDQTFAEFCNRPDLPDFDYIGLHGIWSWISDENRKVIVDFIRSKLKVGGVLYISYNTLPGWAPFAPMRHLLTEHAETIGAEGHGIVNRINGALDFADKLLAVNPIYGRMNTQIAERLKSIKGQNRQYLAHEYFNRDWHPMHFSTMANWLSGAKLNFACSAHLLEHVDAVNLSDDQQKFLKEIADPVFRETVRDFIVNQQFRRDYWVKGARKLNPLDQAEAMRALKVVLVVPPADVPLKIATALGEASLNKDIYHPILELLKDHTPRTLSQLEQGLREQKIVLAQIVQAVLILTGAGHLALADDTTMAKTRKQTDRLNQYLLHKARGNNEIAHLASPVTGGAVPVNRFQQLFLLAKAQGKKSPDEWAEFAWQILSAQNQRVIKDGKPLAADEDNLAEILVRARDFSDKYLIILQKLQIA